MSTPSTSQNRDDGRFCAMCGVVLELHPDDPDPDGGDCETAERKADLLHAFDRTFGLVR